MERRITPRLAVILLAAILLQLSGCGDPLLETLKEDVLRAQNGVLSVNSDGNGTVSPSGEITVISGDTVTISATSNSGYVFIRWTGSGIIFGNPYDAETTVRLTGSSATVTANFADALAVKDLTVQSGGNGSTSPAGLVPALPGSPVAISAMPDYAYTFDGWSIIGGSPLPVFAEASSAGTTVTILEDSIVQANFSLLEYLLTVESTTYGTVIPSAPQTVVHGDITAITATPDDPLRCIFEGWSVVSGTASIANPANETTTATLTAGDATVQANFDKFTIYYGINADGMCRNTNNWSLEQYFGASGYYLYGIDLDPSNGHIYFTTGDQVLRCDMDGENTTGIAGGAGAHGIALDLDNGKIYWTNWQSGMVMRANLDGTDPELLFSCSNPRGIDIDIANQKVYVSSLSGGIYEYDLATSAYYTVASFGGCFHLHIDQINRRLYCSTFPAPLIVLDIDNGFSTEKIISVGNGQNQVYVDPENEQIAIIASYENAIYLTDLDGNQLNRYVIVTSGYPYAVALDIVD